MKQYFIIINPGEESLGPFSLEELKSKAINSRSMVWCEGMNDWCKAVKLPELASVIPPRLPVARQPLRLTMLLIALFMLFGLGGFIAVFFNSETQVHSSAEETGKEALQYARNYTKENIHELVYLQTSTYHVKLIGGVSGLKVSVYNSSEFLMDLVSVDIRYLKKYGGVFKTETIHFNNIKPHTFQTQHAPESNRGSSVECSIALIKSADIGL